VKPWWTDACSFMPYWLAPRTSPESVMPRVIICDVNETLLDVGALEPDVKEVFGDAHVLQDWFATVLL
jgi:hypothetical protein